MRGGKRNWTGRKRTWQNEKTCTIRVPVALAEQLPEIAHALDKHDPIPKKVVIVDVVLEMET